MTSKCKRYCSVPQCKNYKTESISIHFFPKDPLLSNKWTAALRIGKPISKCMSVCCEHFLATDFHPLRLYSTKRYLKTGVVPSQKIPVRKFDRPQPSTSSAQMIRTKKRNEKSECQNQSTIGSTNAEELKVERTATPDFIKDIQQLDGELPAVDETVNVDKSIQDNVLEERDKSLRFHEYLLSSNGKLIVYTGVHIKLFNTIQKLVINTLKLFPTLNANNTEKKICIILTKLKLNLSFHALSIMYELTTTTVQNYFHDYINVLYFALKPVINFPTEENFHNLPTCFKEYKEVRIFIDATEIPIQKPSCLDCGTNTYSCFKKTHTCKFLICVNPAGLIVRVRRAYGGCVLDKAICNSEKNIDLLDPYQDGIMVYKSILVEKEFAEKWPFLHNKQQLAKKQALKTASSIASARVHVERSIESIKFFKIFTNELEWSLVPYLTEMMTIVCALVNFSKPILSDDEST